MHENLCRVPCAEISGPCWTIPLKPNELADILGMLAQLRMMVANLSAQGQWLGGNGDRPASRVKVGLGMPGFHSNSLGFIPVAWTSS